MSDPATSQHNANPSALPAGTRLGEFELRSLLGIGGFGIVYLAFDHALEREVAVKEYMPASLAGRTETLFVSIRSQSDAETFALGLKSFVNEARLLARFDHPSLLKVHRFWEANGTAYMAMPVLRGRTVKAVRQAMDSPPDETWLRSVLDPLLGAIEKLHSEGVYHRDIAPDNIQIEPGGHPVLLDFGAARRVLSDKSQALTAILKPAYAPIEQYAEAGSVKQGPWTDIYALGATLHFLMLGRPPPPATARAVHDDASALTTQAVPGCSENFLHIVDWMLAPRPADRPQSVAALRDVLEQRAPTPLRRTSSLPPVSDWDRTVIMPSAHAAATTLGLPAAQPMHADADPRTVRVARPVPAADMKADMKADIKATAVSLAAAAVAGGRFRFLMAGLGVGALVLVVAATLALMGKPATSTAVVDGAAASAPAAGLLGVAGPAGSAGSAALAALAGNATPAAAPAATVAESAIATVVVAPVTQSVAAPAAAPGASAPRPTASRASRTVAPLAAAPAATLPGPAAAAPEPVKPRVDVASGPAPESTSVLDAAKPVASNPEALCGGRNPLRYFVCMEKECLRSEQMDHADCKKWRRNATRQD